MNYIFLLLCIVLTGCRVQNEPPHCIIAGKVALGFAKKLAKTDGLSTICYGGAMMGDIQKINLGFDTDQCLSQKEIRKLIVHKAEEFLSTINENLEIRPYLHDYPFTIKNIKFSIMYSKRRNKNAFYPHVFSAQIVRGKILYLTYESEFDSFTSEPPPEPYEEALRMVYEDESAENCK